MATKKTVSTPKWPFKIITQIREAVQTQDKEAVTKAIGDAWDLVVRERESRQAALKEKAVPGGVAFCRQRETRRKRQIRQLTSQINKIGDATIALRVAAAAHLDYAEAARKLEETPIEAWKGGGKLEGDERAAAFEDAKVQANNASVVARSAFDRALDEFGRFAVRAEKSPYFAAAA